MVEHLTVGLGAIWSCAMLMSCVLPLYDQKRKEDFSMTLQFPQKAQQTENKRLSSLLPSILTVVKGLPLHSC